MICGAFYPNYFSSSDLDEAEVMKIMSGHDPCTTVIVSEKISSGGSLLVPLILFQVPCFFFSLEERNHGNKVSGRAVIRPRLSRKKLGKIRVLFQ